MVVSSKLQIYFQSGSIFDKAQKFLNFFMEFILLHHLDIRTKNLRYETNVIFSFMDVKFNLHGTNWIRDDKRKSI